MQLAKLKEVANDELRDSTIMLYRPLNSKKGTLIRDYKHWSLRNQNNDQGRKLDPVYKGPFEIIETSGKLKLWTQTQKLKM